MESESLSHPSLVPPGQGVRTLPAGYCGQACPAAGRTELVLRINGKLGFNHRVCRPSPLLMFLTPVRNILGDD